ITRHPKAVNMTKSLINGLIGIGIKQKVEWIVEERTAMSELRDSVGVILRAPVVLAVTILWICTAWPLVVFKNLLAIVCLPMAYPFAFALTWLQYAFLAKRDEILPEYWKDYPDGYIKNMSAGFPALKKMLLKGFDE
ncbi:hypothetical protein VU06_05205, partial [Desulfobulbus sp. F3]|nr:hypothetical protein [Desulfobulbus sp. F3]